MDRITLDELYIESAKLQARRSTCNRGQVGCVIVRDRRIISTGYNGSPPGMDHCTEVGCEELTLYERHTFELDASQYMAVELGCQRTVHAEQNAVNFAARSGVQVSGATAYCTHSPCRACAQNLAIAGISAIVYDKFYRATPYDLLDQMGLIFYQWEGKLPPP